MRVFGFLIVFASGLSVGYLLSGGGHTHAAPRARPDHAPFADRIIVTQPDPAAPGGRSTHLMHVEQIGGGPVPSADRTDSGAWAITLVQDTPDDTHCVTYTATK
jgi:hypothetical protein